MLELLKGLSEALNWVFPSYNIILMMLGWLAVIITFSSLANHQTKANKILNSKKSIGYTLFLVTLTNVITIYNSDMVSYRSIVIGFLGLMTLLSGDWLAYALYRMHVYPGGLAGLYWHFLSTLSRKLNHYATDKFNNCLDSSEKKIIQLNLENKKLVSNPIIEHMKEIAG